MVLFLVFTFAFLIMSMIMSKNIGQDSPVAQDFKATTSDEGASIPVVFGTAWVGQNVVFWGDVNTTPITKKQKSMFGSKKQTVGFRYHVDFQVSLCYGVIDSIRRIVADDDKVILDNSDFPTVRGYYFINKPELFGGDDGGGGIVGSITVLKGSRNQGVGLKVAQSEQLPADQIPAYRGVATMYMSKGWNNIFNFLSFDFFNGGRLSLSSGMYIGNSPSMRPWQSLVQRVFKGSFGDDQWYKEKAGISSSAALDTKPFKITITQTHSLGTHVEEARYKPEDGYFYSLDGSSSSTYIDLSDSISYDKNQQVTVTFSESSKPLEKNQFIEISFIISGTFYDYDMSTPSGASIVSIIDRPDRGSKAKEVIFILSTYNCRYVFDFKPFYQNPGDISNRISAWISVSSRSVFTDSTWDMNPAHIIREVLTDENYGLSMPASMIDDDSFILAADTLHAENFGLSMVWSLEDSAAEFIGEVLRHIGGFLYAEPSTGKQTLKLVRGDYDKEDLLVIDESNCLSISDISRPAFSELINQITVKYTNTSFNQNSSISIQDLALVSMQGVVNNKSVEYGGITNQRLASLVAQRDLKSYSGQYFRMDVTVTRSIGLSLRQGDVIRLKSQKYSISDAVMRVMAIDYGTQTSNAVVLSLVEDVFYLPSSSTISSDAEEVSINTEVQDVRSFSTMELGYYDLVQRYGKAETDQLLASSPLAGFYGALVEKPNSVAKYLNLYSSLGVDWSLSGSDDFSPTDKLRHEMGVDSKYIEFSSSMGILMDLQMDGQMPILAKIDDEIVLIEFARQRYVEAIGELVYDTGVKRAVLDTVPKAHAAGTKIHLIGPYLASDGIQRYVGDQVVCRAVAVGDASRSDVYSAPDMPLTIKARATRPYPPANAKLNGFYSHDVTEVVGIIGLTWCSRNRLAQDEDFISWFDDVNIPSEQGIIYHIEAFDMNNNSGMIFADVTQDLWYDLTLPSQYYGKDIKVTISSFNGVNRNLIEVSFSFKYLAPVATPINFKATYTG